jgi:hypothetical protein
MIWLGATALAPFLAKRYLGDTEGYWGVCAMILSHDAALLLVLSGRAPSVQAQAVPDVPRVDPEPLRLPEREPESEAEPERNEAEVIPFPAKPQSIDEVIAGVLRGLPRTWLATQRQILIPVNMECERHGITPVTQPALSKILRGELRLQTRKRESGTQYFNKLGQAVISAAPARAVA